MNPDLQKLQPYPFQKLAALFGEVQPNPDYRAISLSIGEPKHDTPQFIKDALTAGLDGLANYPQPQAATRCAARMQTGSVRVTASPHSTQKRRSCR